MSIANAEKSNEKPYREKDRGYPEKDKGYQEIAPEVALDRAVIVSLGETVETPAGEFEGSLKIKEITPLEPASKDFKWYAPNIGLVQSNTLKLVEHGHV